MGNDFATLKKLALGCGHVHDQNPEWVYHDRTRHHDDIRCVFDLEFVSKLHRLRYNAATGMYELTTQPSDLRFGEVLAKDVLEHIPPSLIINVVEFVWNILAPDGVFTIIVPEANSENALIDPTHYRGFHLRSFEMFDPETSFGRKSSFYGLRPWRLETAERLPRTNVNLLFRLRKREGTA